MPSQLRDSAEANNLTRDEARRRAESISGVEYEIALDFTTGEEVFRCEELLRFTAKGTSETFLDYTAPNVLSITLNNEPVPAGAFDGNRIRLETLKEKNELRIVGESAYTNKGIGMHRFVDPVDGEAYVHSDLEPFDAHRIYPCFDQPDIKGTFEFTVAAPAAWEIVSNSKPVDRPEAGKSGTWRFGATPKISTYITAVVAGPYHVIRDVHRGIELGLYCRKSLAKYLEPDAGEIFTITKQGLDYFEREYDYPYSFGKYDQLFVPEFNPGAMENAGAVTFNERAIFRSKVTDAAREGRATTILHEMAHMWFGDLVTMKWWDDLWLNESFATYASIVALVEATRFTNAWIQFAGAYKAAAYRADQLPSTHPICADVPDIAATKTNFDSISYSKGASVLRQLVAWVGRKEFDSGVRRYFRNHEYGNTDLSDFLTALEETSGRDLRAWSKQWLETAGVNSLSPEIELSGDLMTSFAVAQSAPAEHPTLRDHRIAVGLYDLVGGKLSRRTLEEMDVSGARTDVPKLAGERVADLVLLNDLDYGYAKITLDEASLRTVVGNLRALDDPLARAIVWSATWEMVRDAQMKTRDYVSLLVNNILGEKDVTAVQLLLGRGAQAISAYSDPANRDALRHDLASFVLRQLRESAPGSDLQLSWGGAFIGSARTPEHLEILSNLLDGSLAVEGFPIDVDRRWAIVASLVRADAQGDDLIARELERDPTDQGKRYSFAVRSFRPTAAAKQEAWRAITEDMSLPLASMRSHMAGFSDQDQQDLIRPYVEPYFEKVPQFWAGREYDVAMSFVAGMLPRVLVSDELIARIDAFLEEANPAFPVRRMMVEARDDMQRALRARAFDASSDGGRP